MTFQDLELTGFFADGLRRIDIVLVVSDGRFHDNIDKMKIDFLINIIKVGLEIEVESAVMKRHENLIFVKVHAPNSLIEEYGRYYNVRKYFKEPHNEFINPNENILYMNGEKDYIKTVRKYYPGPFNYSTIERITIVYQILLSLPFGQHENFIGLQRLIEKNIIVDAYALHDGPHFLRSNEKPTKINGRQALFYNWIGNKYFFKRPPLHLIREYFGEKVGIYFAFYEYLNMYLVFTSLLGIFISIESLNDSKDAEVIKEACNKNETDGKNFNIVCPMCRDFNTCPFRNLTDFCVKVTITNFIDSPWTMIYCILISLGAMSFVVIWRRRKNYLFWLWEYDHTDTREVVRSEFETDVNKIRKSKLTGIVTDSDGIQIRLCRLVFTALLIFLWFLLMLMITITLIIWKYELSAKFNNWTNIGRDYWAVTAVTCINVFITTILQKFSTTLSYHFCRIENHKMLGSFDTAFITKSFCFGFICNFTLLIYYYFLNVLYTYPSDENRWYLVGGVGMMNCGPESCLDELCVALVVTVIVREYLFNMPSWFLKTKSEYALTDDNVPFWEKEYLLKPFTDFEMIAKFNKLVLQFTLDKLFGTVFPFTPLLLLLSNSCNLRRDVAKLVVGRRRPLLHQLSSQRVWYKIMLGVVYAVPCFNTVAMTWMTTMLHYSRDDHGPSYFAYSMGRFVTEDYKKVTGSGSPAEAIENYKGFVPTECLFPGLRFRSKKLDGEYFPIERFWRIRHDKHRLMLEVEHLALLLMVILHYASPAYPRDITDTIAAEERIKRREKIEN